MSRDNCRNVEIKAKLKDQHEFNEKVNRAIEITSENERKLLLQEDVFFKTTNGRLKLRYEEGSKSKLIQYDRDDIEGPKVSKFNILEVEDGELLEKMLTQSFGVLGILEKKRHLFMYDRTRIHLDMVKNEENIFYGFELEVMLAENEDIETGNKIAEDLLEKFNINKDQLLKGSYFEILNAKVTSI